MSIAITGTGSYIPPRIVTNKDFLQHEFFASNGMPLAQPNDVIIDKFQAITGIEERRYAPDEMNTSDMGFLAAEKAISDAGIDKDSIDHIIFAHNFGDIAQGQNQSDTVPSLASRVKHHLQINNPHCVAYDLLFGCPGWLQGLIQAKAFIDSGIARTCLVIGGETLSRIIDPYDRDSMIYADGAGAAIVQAGNDGGNILAHASASFSSKEAFYLFFGNSYKEKEDSAHYIKMYGRKIYEFALTHVPKAMKDCLSDSGVDIEDIKKIFIHQANEKMDEAIIKRFYALYDKEPPAGVMPMSIGQLGNSSVATIPSLFDQVRKGKMENQEVQKGDVVIFASVGAGMNVNAIVYQI